MSAFVNPRLSEAGTGFAAHRLHPGAIAGIAIVLTVVALPAADDPSSPVTEEGPRLSGRVLAEDGRPLSGARIRFRALDGQEEDTASSELEETVTGEDGRFSIAGSRFDLRVSAEDHAFWTARNRESVPALEVRLERGAPVSGRVRSESTGEAIAGATVRLDDGETFDLGGAELETTTDDEGLYVFAHAPTGKIFVRAAADGKATRSIRGRVPPARSPAPEDPTIVLDDLWLPDGGRLAGRVVDDAGKPVVDAVVWLSLVDGMVGGYRDRYSKARTRTDDRGRFELDGVLAGARYLVRAEADRHAPATAGPFAPRPGAALDDVLVTMSGGAALRLQLLDPDDRPASEPTAHFRYAEHVPHDRGAPSIAPDSDRMQVDDQGWVTIRHLRPGTYTVRLEAAGLIGLRREGVVLVEGETTDLGSLTAEPGASLGGQVVDGSGAAVPGATVKAVWRDMQGNYSRRVDGDHEGNFLVSGLPEHRVTLEVSAEGFSDRRMPDVTGGGEDLVVTLDRPGTIVGHVVLAGREISASFLAIASSGDGEKKSSEGDPADGSFAIRDLAPGTYSVEIRSPKMAPARIGKVRVRAGEKAEVEKLELKAGRSLRGRVVRGVDGSAVPGARLRIDRGPAPTVWARPYDDAAAVSDPAGRFGFDGLEDGRYTLTLDHPGFAPVQRSVDLEPDVAIDSLEIRLTTGGELRGSVTDADGLPVAGVDIYMVRGLRGFDRRTTATLDDGTFGFTRLAPGTYMIVRSTARSTFSNQIRTVDVREGEVTTLEFADRENP